MQSYDSGNDQGDDERPAKRNIDLNHAATSPTPDGKVTRPVQPEEQVHPGITFEPLEKIEKELEVVTAEFDDACHSAVGFVDDESFCDLKEAIRSAGIDLEALGHEQRRLKRTLKDAEAATVADEMSSLEQKLRAMQTDLHNLQEPVDGLSRAEGWSALDKKIDDLVYRKISLQRRLEDRRKRGIL